MTFANSACETDTIMQSNSGKMVCENCLTEDEEDDGFGDMLLELAGE